MTRYRSALIGVALGAAFLVIAAWSVDFDEVVSILGRANLSSVVAIVVTVGACVYVKTLRWCALIRPVAPTSARELFPAVSAGNAGNYVIPHFGELLRVLVAGNRLGVSRSALLASIAIERLFDFVSLALLAGVLLLPARGLSAEASGAIWLVSLLALVLSVVIVIYMFQTEAILRVMARLLRRFPTHTREFVLRQLRQGAAGLAMIRRPKLLVVSMLLSLLLWGLIGLTMGLSLAAVGITPVPDAVMAVLLLNVVGLVLPAAPGHVGTIQLAFGVGLAAFHVRWDTAIAASIVYNATVVAAVMSLGVPAMVRALLPGRAVPGAQLPPP